MGNGSSEIEIRKMRPGEEIEISRMVLRSFDRFVAPTFLVQGIEEFRHYSDAAWMAKRSKENHFVLVAMDGDIPAGMIEMRDFIQVSMFFVDPDYLQRGIGRLILGAAIDICQENIPDLEMISVFSSPYAVPVYEKLGFHQTGPDEYKHGMHFVPMIMDL